MDRRKMKRRKVFLFETKSGSEYLAVLTKSDVINALDLLLLVQLAGGDRRIKGGIASLPRFGVSWDAYYVEDGEPRHLRTSWITKVREI